MKLFTPTGNTTSKSLLISFVFAITCGFVSAQQMTVTPGTNLVLNGSVSLVLNNAALENNGAFIAGSSTVKFSGHNDTLISYVSGISTTTFNNLTVSKSAYGVALKSVVGVKNVLSVSAGNLYTDSNLTLLSDKDLTALVDVVPSTSQIVGKTMVERYIPARRAWRLMTAPVANSNTIYNSWQNNGVYTVAKGMLITGSNPGGANGNGLDYSAQNTASLKSFNYSTQGFVKISNTKVAISQGNGNSAANTGYFVFIRGDRNPINTTLGNDNVTTITSIGTLQTGTQTFNASSAYGAYTLIGNPYASPVSFDNITRSNVIKRFYVWDPSLNIVGGYVMMDDLDNDGIYSKSVGGSAQTKDIQSSQAFFVQTNAAGAASVTFNESSKSINNNNLVFRPITGSATGKITAALNLLNTDSTTILADGTLVEFNNAFSDSVDLNDASKFGNTNENISVVRNNALLAAERRPAPASNDTVYFRLGNTTQRNYQLVLNTTGIESTVKALLQDSYLGTSTEMNLSGITTVNFTINAEAASASINRFMIVFSPNLTVLPVKITTVKASLKKNDINVEWKVENELNMVKYDVEKSTDGASFSRVNTTNVTGANNSYNTYSWLDVNAVQGNNFYRIKAYDKSGEVKYSSVVKVATGKSTATSGFSIYPNPVTGSVINLVMTNQPAGTYNVKLTNITGQVIFVKSIQTNGANSTEALSTGSKLIAGIYQLEIIGQDNNHDTQKVIVE